MQFLMQKGYGEPLGMDLGSILVGLAAQVQDLGAQSVQYHDLGAHIHDCVLAP